MANVWFIPIRDENGAVVPNAQFYVYEDALGNTPATLVSPGPTTQPVTTDDLGEKTIYVEDFEVLYFKPVGSTKDPVPVRCANQPSFDDLATDETPVDTDYFPYWNGTRNCRISFANLKTQLGIPADYVKAGAAGGTNIDVGTLTIGTGAATGGVSGDIHIQIP